MDAEGHLWVALVEAGKIARISPLGEIVTVLDVPVELPTCPAFAKAFLRVAGDKLAPYPEKAAVAGFA